MVKELGASGPHPSLGDGARAFDQLVGTWDCAYTFYLPGGEVRRSTGELRFGWILDGRAMQDLWITYPVRSGDERKIGTSIRFLDGNAGVWRVVFVSPGFNAVIMVEGNVEGDRIVLRGRDSDGAMIRWSFNDIRPDAFLWRGETSRDGGKTWLLEEEHRMTRRSG
jgi:hypothetical protein